MKKVLALVLALVMVCTMAMAVDITGGDTSSKSGNAKGYGIIAIGDNTNTATKTDAGTLTITTTTPKVTKDGDTTITEYKAVEYKFVGTLTAGIDGTYYAVDSSAAQFKLVKDGKIVAFLTNVPVTPTTDDVVSKVVKYAVGDKLVCGDYNVPHGADNKVTVATTLYIIDGKAYTAGGANWAVLNGAFVQYVAGAVNPIGHDFDANKTNVANSVITSVYCNNCDKYIPVVKTNSIPVTTLDQYEELGGALADYSYLVKAVSTTTTTTNPDTGANDVIGVAAALAVVALVSGAAISLKK